MDFSDLSSYPVVANTDYSPTNDAFSYTDDPFDKAYLADAYTVQPDHALSAFVDCDSFFDRPVTSIELPAGFVQKTQAAFNSTFPASATQFVPVSSLADVQNTSFESSCVSPHTQHSPTPSLCGDAPRLPHTSSPELSPRLLKHEPASSPEPESAPKRPQRKRGRPKLERTTSDTPSISSAKCQRTSRLPHNQVERKYREGLNAELERLRRAVPTLLQSEDGVAVGQPKPSKAMVLAGAIEYIKKIERERDLLKDENDRLTGGL
ncbi:hypothetical protein BDV95DRAFT_258963 [Massariosphaeria phaeospora]|uniref:BHLH domain-containing protein n=1 Tax=Massariosphaeria phaeospora TaxID=100035 RepID=A0A7C8HYT2_9PLEO|nr:hypothetical protein BDV95DRAFT_258963 [Massariosphaeria phaeospora]